MEGLYHGYPLGQDAFFANTEAEALAEFSKRAGCEVRKCVYPVRSERVYYISEHGDIFGLIEDKRKHVFIGYSSKKQLRHKNGKRQIYGVLYSVKNYLTGKDSVVKAENLVYCTFVLGKWRDDITIRFKDGDPYNVYLENIEEPKETYSPIWSEHMSEQARVYQREFNRVVDYVSWFCSIRIDEAQDCVQDTFIWLTSDERTMPSYFIGAWMFWSKMNGMHYLRDRAKMCTLEDWDGWRNDRPIDIDILGMIKNDKHRDMLMMKLLGYTDREVAQKYGTTAGSVHSTVGLVVKNLRTKFQRDFKVLGIKPQEGVGRSLFGKNYNPCRFG